MPKTEKPSQSEISGQVSRPLKEQGRIDSALLMMSQRIGRDLTAERINLWHADLASYEIEGIEWAFESWGKNARTLPTLGQVTQLLLTWNVDVRKKEPKEWAHHCGRGYGWMDVSWLLRRRMAEARDGVKWSISDWEELMSELDAKREGGAPAWRLTPDGQRFLRIE